MAHLKNSWLVYRGQSQTHSTLHSRVIATYKKKSTEDKIIYLHIERNRLFVTTKAKLLTAPLE
jgi:FMN-dependent NADH-azoreductase